MKNSFSIFHLPLVFSLAFFPLPELNPYQSGNSRPWKGEFFVKHSFPAYPHAVSKQSNLWLTLSDMGFDKVDIMALVEAAKPYYNLSRILPSVPFRVEYPEATEIRKRARPSLVEFQLDRSHLLRLQRTDEGWEASEKIFPSTTEIVTFQGEVRDALWNSAVEADMTPTLIVNLTEIFAWQVDFAREVHPGDRWRISVEKKMVRGRFAGWGEIIAAEYVNQGVTHRAVRFVRNGETLGYFTPEGESLEKLFLKSPLKFGRISSGFSRKRFHPVRKVYRPHLGVDYAAPTGTPIRAVGDGRVTMIGRLGGAGNMIRLRHNSVYQTRYLHMSRFAKGLKNGSRVKQGQVIGYVGSTGLATGPHLHYEFYQNDRFVDPLKVKFPSAQPVPTGYLAEFESAAEKALQSLPEWPREVAAADTGKNKSY